MELGVTHILNAAAPKMTWLGKLKQKGLKGKILTGPEYYEGMDIKYCGLPTTYDQFRIIKYFWPAGKFIRKALRNPDNVLFIHCKHGVSHAPTLFVAYLMMYYKIPLEEAMGYVTRARRIRPFSSFLLQLSLLEPKKKKEKASVWRSEVMIPNRPRGVTPKMGPAAGVGPIKCSSSSNELAHV
ncbi:dual specificity phosphatase 29-like [Danio aesculapii]|uniref:dual specificity phosphatase 29-like n=1 Tax=Danio aesculapii TaxID=1142201 RepID=UPI0024C07FCC|nr:dual specificity phosphatase 29-like [Danio aesculapii]